MSPKDSTYLECERDGSLEQRTLGVVELSNPQAPQMNFLGRKTRKIQFKEQAQVKYMSTDETELRTKFKSEIWYVKSDLMTMRKNDRQSLLLALRNVAATARERASAALEGNASSAYNGSAPPPPPQPSSPVVSESEFCFRGMEIILYKKEREESRRRAMQAVLTEQHRQRIKENERKEKGILVLEPPAMNAQQRISEEYRLMTRKAYDDAYLRGLGDAQEARTIFQQSLYFPSATIRRTQKASDALEESKNPESPNSYSRRETIGDDQREAPVDVPSPAALSDLLSQKMILQRNSQLKSVANTNDPGALRLAAKYQSDASTVHHSWSCCTYEKK
jgi:hypothetical protein